MTSVGVVDANVNRGTGSMPMGEGVSIDITGAIDGDTTGINCEIEVKEEVEC